MQIYKIINNFDSRIYVGCTVKTIEQRFKSHKRKVGKYNSPLYDSMNKHGIENYFISLIEKCYSKKEMYNREIYWIKQYNSLYPSGYNLTKGGTGGDTFTNKSQKEKKKHRLKLSKALKGNNLGISLEQMHGKKKADEIRKKISRKGCKHSEQTKIKMSKAQKLRFKNKTNHPLYGKIGELSPRFGKKHTKETKAKIKANIPNKNGKNNPFYGKRHSEETKKKISETKKEKKRQ